MTARPFSLKAYDIATGLMGPVADAVLRARLRAGKEDPDRIGERRGKPSLDRPDGPLVWIHGASVGESLSVLPLIDRLAADMPGTRFLVTTGTVTSARLMAERLPPSAMHQYAPIDHPAFVRRFLDHWRPDAGIFVESELWPTLIGTLQERGVPLALVNGRMSPRSFEGWKKRAVSARSLLSAFSVILAQDRANAERLRFLSGRDVVMSGNLKHAADLLPVEASAMHRLSEAVSGRPVWLAASTHRGEEDDILAVHRQTAGRIPDLLTMIVPRHPGRGDEVAALIGPQQLSFARRTLGQLPRPEDAVYLGDTLGELGLFYRISDVTFIGGSLSQTGGHNPLEAGRLGCAIVTGPNLFNFTDIYQEMRAAGAAAIVRNRRDLAASLLRLLTDPMTRGQMAQSATGWAERAAAAVLDDVVKTVRPVIEAGMGDRR